MTGLRWELACKQYLRNARPNDVDMVQEYIDEAETVGPEEGQITYYDQFKRYEDVVADFDAYKKFAEEEYSLETDE